MLRIRRVYDDVLPIDQEVIKQVKAILGDQFPLLTAVSIDKISDALRNPLKHRFRSTLFVAEGVRGRVKGFALLQHASDLGFSFLDLVSAAKTRTGGGIGGALYDRVREEAVSLKSMGIFFECLPDDQALCRDPEVLKQNIARLRFYERYGAFPLANTAYETPLSPDDDCPPYLMFDDLGQGTVLQRDTVRTIVRAILERKYADLCPRSYVDLVIESLRDDPVQLRSPRYVKATPLKAVRPVDSLEKKIALVVSDKHVIHNVRDRGYVESPVRIKTILKELEPTGLFDVNPVHHFSEQTILDVHDRGMVDYFKKVCANVIPGKSVYPYVFPIRNAARPPKELPVRAGYYCIDTFTPLNENAYVAAKRAVDCALTGATKIFEGYRLAYALVRPPGHHAERRAFGGFCYFNSASVAAQYLCRYGKVAILDIDYHHGNGTQNIFYSRSDVLTVSIHGHPRIAYPYFSGFDDEKGEGPGEGYNINIPLGEQINGEQYREALKKALRAIGRFQPRFLVVALGLDTAKGDPTGSWNLQANDFEMNGRMIGALSMPILVVQEGGYRIRSLGRNARKFFTGLWHGVHGPREKPL